MLDGHGADGRAGRRARAARPARAALPGPRRRRARRRWPRRTDAIRAFNAGAPAARRCGSCGCRPGRDPADVVAARRAPAAMRALLDGAVPVARFEVERALEAGRARHARGPRPRAARRRAGASRGWSRGSLQDDLIRLVADRLRDAGGVTQEALRRAPRAAATAGARRRRAARRAHVRHVGRQARGRRARLPRPLPRRQGRRPPRRSRRWTSTRRSPPSSPAAPPTTSPSTSSTPASRCPAGADDLARLIAELVIRAGDLAADPDALALERLSSTSCASTGRSRPRAARASQRRAGGGAPARAGRDPPPAGLAHARAAPLPEARSLAARCRGLALGAVDGADDAAGFGDADEAELRVVRARRVEVDRADAQDPLR